MKTLYLMRHAKSSLDMAGISDHDRPIIEKGKRRTELIAQHLKQNEEVPQLILCSTAKRARETAKIIASSFELKKKQVVYQKEIYELDTNGLFDLLFSLPDDVERVLMIGHNPVISELATLLSRCPYEDMPTSAVHAVELHCEKWVDAASCRCNKKFYISPKMLKA
jgi:phosphohistidine phosphatase